MFLRKQAFRSLQILMPLGLTALLTACPPPPPVVTLYQAVLVNQLGSPSTATSTVTGTLNTSTLVIIGDILNAAPTDTFSSASLTCIQTQALSIGEVIVDGVVKNKTIFGNFTNGTTDDRTALDNGLCVIKVYSAGSNIILQGNLKR